MNHVMLSYRDTTHSNSGAKLQGFECFLNRVKLQGFHSALKLKTLNLKTKKRKKNKHSLLN